MCKCVIICGHEYHTAKNPTAFKAVKATAMLNTFDLSDSGSNL